MCDVLGAPRDAIGVGLVQSRGGVELRRARGLRLGSVLKIVPGCRVSSGCSRGVVAFF